MNRWMPGKSIVKKIRHKVGQFIGGVSGVGACGLWLTAMWSPALDFTLSGPSFVVGFVMALFAIGAIIASVRDHSVVLIVLFLASFFPVGVYFFSATHWLHWIGVFNVGYLVAGLLMWQARPPVAQKS